MANLHGLTDADLRKLRDVARRVGAGRTSQRPVAQRRRNPGGGSAPAPDPGLVVYLAWVVGGTPGYIPGGIKPAEIPTTGPNRIKMFKGWVQRYTTLTVEDEEPLDENEEDYSEPESEDATSVTWYRENNTPANQYTELPADENQREIDKALEVLNWVKAPIQIGDRVFIAKIQLPNGHKRWLITARDCS